MYYIVYAKKTQLKYRYQLIKAKEFNDKKPIINKCIIFQQAIDNSILEVYNKNITNLKEGICMSKVVAKNRIFVAGIMAVLLFVAICMPFVTVKAEAETSSSNVSGNGVDYDYYFSLMRQRSEIQPFADIDAISSFFLDVDPMASEVIDDNDRVVLVGCTLDPRKFNQSKTDAFVCSWNGNNFKYKGGSGEIAVMYEGKFAGKPITSEILEYPNLGYVSDNLAIGSFDITKTAHDSWKYFTVTNTYILMTFTVEKTSSFTYNANESIFYNYIHFNQETRISAVNTSASGAITSVYTEAQTTVLPLRSDSAYINKK